MHSVETILQVLNFDLFPGWQYSEYYFPVVLASDSEPQFLVTLRSQDTLQDMVLLS